MRSLSEIFMANLKRFTSNEDAYAFYNKMRDFNEGGGCETMTIEELAELADGLKATAIKMIRTRTGLGLKEAKAVADRYERLLESYHRKVMDR